MQVTHDRQKSYADLKRKPMEVQVRDRVMLKVSPWKGVVRFGKRGTLNPRYVGPFQVLAKVGAIAYKLELPQELSIVHNTFHVSNLKKCYADEPLAVPLDRLHLDDKLQFVEEPVEIIDREVKWLRKNCVPIVKVLWNFRRGPECTWEREDQFQKKYPHLFTKTALSSTMNPSSMFSSVESTCPTTAIDCFDELTKKIWRLFVAMTVQGVKQQTAVARRLQQQVDSMFLLFMEVRLLFGHKLLFAHGKEKKLVTIGLHGITTTIFIFLIVRNGGQFEYWKAELEVAVDDYISTSGEALAL
ncbi:hypothetical protein Tco_0398492 [Tanacetum coccineum]